jgi:hypothetical protein
VIEIEDFQEMILRENWEQEGKGQLVVVKII